MKRAATKVWAAVGAVLLATITAVVVARANAAFNPPEVTITPTRTTVTTIGTPSPSTGSPSQSRSTPLPSASSQTTRSNSTQASGVGSSSPGWLITPTALGNDFLTVTAKMDPGDACDGAPGWVFPKRLQEIGPYHFLKDDPSRWAETNGGVPQSGNSLTLTVENRNHHPVTIEKLGVRVVRRSSPLSGVAPNMPSGCGGGLTESYFAANLDAATVSLKPIDGSDAAGNVVKAVSLPHLITDSAPTEVWNLQFTSKGCSCEFVPYFVWESGGLSGTFEVPNNGSSWQISGVSNAAQIYYNNATESWQSGKPG